MKSMKFLFVFIGLGFICYGISRCEDKECVPVKTETSVVDSLKTDSLK